jgi:hypothetical protein
MLEELKNILIKNWLFDKNIEIKEIKESDWNHIFCHWNYFIKIAREANEGAIINESNILKLLPEDKIFPRVILLDYLAWNIPCLVISRLEWKIIEYERNNYSGKQKVDICNQIIDGLKKINNIKWEKNIESIKSDFKKYFELAQSNNFVTQDFLKKLENLRNEEVENLNYEDFCLCHLDFWYKNILVKDWKITWIIDFELARFVPLSYERLRIQYTDYYIKYDEWDNTEKEFMKYFLQQIDIEYPNLKKSLKTMKLFHILEIVGKLWRYKESWYEQVSVDRLYDYFL